jgi:hypothetical protein
MAKAHAPAALSSLLDGHRGNFTTVTFDAEGGQHGPLSKLITGRTTVVFESSLVRTAQHGNPTNRKHWAKDSAGRKVLSSSTTDRLDKVATSDARRGGVNSIVSLVITVLDLSYLPLSYCLGMQFLPRLSAAARRHLKNSVFNLNKPKEVEALRLVVQKVFMAVELVAANENSHTESNFDGPLFCSVLFCSVLFCSVEELASGRAGLSAEKPASGRTGLSVEKLANGKTGLSAEKLANGKTGLSAEKLASGKTGLSAEKLASGKTCSNCARSRTWI